MILFLAAVLVLQPAEIGRTASFRFQPFDDGLPRAGQWRHGFDVADMNGDGRPDLAFTSPRKSPGPPVIFLNEGKGRWSRWEDVHFPSLPYDYGAVAAADFDGDGFNDLALGSHYTGVTVVHGDGRGTFSLSQPGMTFGGAPFSSRAVVTTDWNGDGRVDVAALSDGPRPLTPGVQLGVTVFENHPTSWNPVRAPGTDPLFGDVIAAGDIDGDRLPDLVTASHATGENRLLRLGLEHTLQPRPIATFLQPAIVRAADLHDFDGDGRDEILVAYSSLATGKRSIEIDLLSLGANTVWQLWSEEGSRDVTAVAAGDINGDRSPDAVAVTSDGLILTFRGDGHGFLTRDVDIEPPEWRRGCAGYAIRLADLDGDGRDEIIAAFAGEGGCASNGGVAVWTMRPPRRRSVR